MTNAASATGDVIVAATTPSAYFTCSLSETI